MPFQIAKVEKKFKSPGPQPNGLQATQDGLWIIDQVDLKIYKVDWETGDVLFEAQTDTEHSSGIALGGHSAPVSSAGAMRDLHETNNPFRRYTSIRTDNRYNPQILPIGGRNLAKRAPHSRSPSSGQSGSWGP